MKTKKYVIYGIVQGVGFRYYVFRLAQELGIGGWVLNCPDETVEVVAKGSEETLAELERELRIGPPASRVTKVDVNETIEVVDDVFRIAKGPL